MTAFIDLRSLNFWKASEQEALSKSEGVNMSREEDEGVGNDSRQQDEGQLNPAVRRSRWRRSRG